MHNLIRIRLPLFKGYFRSYLYDAGEVVLFPRNLEKNDAFFAAAGAGLIGGSFLADKSVELNMRKGNARSFFNRDVIRYGIEPWGSGWYPALFSVGCYSVGLMTDQRALRHSSMVQMKTLGLSMLVAGGAKLLFQRHRPLEQSNPDPFRFEDHSEG